MSEEEKHPKSPPDLPKVAEEGAPVASVPSKLPEIPAAEVPKASKDLETVKREGVESDIWKYEPGVKPPSGAWDLASWKAQAPSTDSRGPLPAETKVIAPESQCAASASITPDSRSRTGEEGGPRDQKNSCDEAQQCHEQVSVSLGGGLEEYVAAHSWEDLNLKPDLLRGIYEKGFAKPSKIQSIALPLILSSNTHVIAQAKNGAGKTATFALAAISKVDQDLPCTQALIISPSRELAQQNLSVLRELSRFTTIKSCLGCPPFREPEGGMNHVISGTPGKLRQWIQQAQISPQSLKLFILDEADTMLDAELGAQVADISRSILRLNQLVESENDEPKVQILLFSATFPEKVRAYANKMAPNAHKLTISRYNLQVSQLRQYWVRLPNATFEQKIQALIDLYDAQRVGKSIIFCNQRQEALRIANAMQAEAHSVTLICGSGGREGLEIAEREKRLEEFRTNVTRVLVCTDLLSRGIDVPSVSLVVNYDLPREFDQGRSTKQAERETYLHRIGRTARFGKKGFAVSFVCNQADEEMIRSITEYYNSQIPELPRNFEELQKALKAFDDDEEKKSS